MFKHRFARLACAVGLLAGLAPVLRGAPGVQERTMGFGGPALALVMGAQEALWVAQKGPQPLVRLDAGGNLKAIEKAPPVAPNHRHPMAWGPDGALWYVAGGEPRLVRITPAGETSFPVPELCAELGPQELRDDPRGGLWLSGQRQCLVRLTVAEGGGPTIKVFPVTAGVPSCFATTLEGDVWFAVAGSTRVGRLTARGLEERYDLPGDLRVTALAQGPDRAIWFACGHQGVLGRLALTPEGRLDVDFQEQVGGAPCDLLTDAPWLGASDPALARLLRIRGGKQPEVRALPLPNRDSLPAALALGPGGNIHYANLAGGIGWANLHRDALAALGAKAHAAAGRGSGEPEEAIGAGVSGPAARATRSLGRSYPELAGRIRKGGLGHLFRDTTDGAPDPVGTAREMVTHYDTPNDRQGPATQLATSAAGELLWLPEGGLPQVLTRAGTPFVLKIHKPDHSLLDVGAFRVSPWDQSLHMLPRDLAFRLQSEPRWTSDKEIPSSQKLPSLEGLAPENLGVGQDGTVWFDHGAGVVAVHGNQCRSWHLVGSQGLAPTPAGDAWFGHGSALHLAFGPNGSQPAREDLERVPLPEGSLPLRLVMGPGGLWFTDPGRNAIGFLAGLGQEPRWHPLPTPDSRPCDILLGPDGNLWFTETMANRIGRLTPAGVLTEFPLARAGGRPGLLAVHGGKLFFSDLTCNRLGSLTVLPPEPPAPARAVPKERQEEKREEKREEKQDGKRERAVPTPLQTSRPAALAPRAPASPAVATAKASPGAKPPSGQAPPSAPAKPVQVDIHVSHILNYHADGAKYDKDQFTAGNSRPETLQALIRRALGARQYPLVGDPYNESVLQFYEADQPVGKAWSWDHGDWVPTRRLVVALSLDLDEVLSAYPVYRFP